MKAEQLENQLQGSKIFFTSSIHLVSYLNMKGLKYVGINRFNDKDLFLFERNEELQKHLDDYRADKYIQSFLDSLREIKSVLAK